MARLTDPKLGGIYDAAALFVERVLKSRDSLFTPGRPIWSEPVLQDLHRRFVEQPDESKNSFLHKFEKQLAGAPDATCQLAGELLFVHLLSGARTSGVHKRKVINAVLGWSSSPVSIPPVLAAALDQGLAAEGTGFNIQKPYMLQYLIEFVQRWWTLDDSARAKALRDPTAFKEIAFALEVPKSKSQREILLHLAHPDFFEPMHSRNHKEMVATSFASLVTEPVEDLDQQLLQIHKALERQAGRTINFYEPDILAKWMPAPEPSSSESEADVESADPEQGSVRYWKIAPGTGARLWQQWRDGGYISIGWEDLGDLSGANEDDFKQRQAAALAAHPDWTPQGSRQVWTFASEIKVGDRIVANRGFFEAVGVGTVIGPYYFVPGQEHGHRIKVRWDNVQSRRIEQRGWRTTLCELDQATFDAIASAPAANAVQAAEVDLALNPVGRLVLDRKNVVLYGPPGTGKTYASLELAELWRQAHGDDSVHQVTFHPTFAYEDFIEGFRPTATGKFELRSGIFVQVCDLAHRNLQRKVLLIIDELNRGDVARLFGELITLIEPDKRDPSVSRKLPYSQQELWVPPNLYLLGTMNTADRSISLLDIAIRRRFCFVEYRPDPAVINASNGHYQSIDSIQLSALMVSLNQRLVSAGIDRDRAIGHSHFLIDLEQENPLEVLRQRLRYDIVPLIEEYCYADRGLMRQVLGHLVNDAGQLDLAIFDEDAQLIAALDKIVNGHSAATTESEMLEAATLA